MIISPLTLAFAFENLITLRARMEYRRLLFRLLHNEVPYHKIMVDVNKLQHKLNTLHLSRYQQLQEHQQIQHVHHEHNLPYSPIVSGSSTGCALSAEQQSNNESKYNVGCLEAHTQIKTVNQPVLPPALSLLTASNNALKVGSPTGKAASDVHGKRGVSSKSLWSSVPESCDTAAINPHLRYTSPLNSLQSPTSANQGVVSTSTGNGSETRTNLRQGDPSPLHHSSESANSSNKQSSVSVGKSISINSSSSKSNTVERSNTAAALAATSRIVAERVNSVQNFLHASQLTTLPRSAWFGVSARKTVTKAEFIVSVLLYTAKIEFDRDVYPWAQVRHCLPY
jgi:hypothetical protein